MEWSLGVTPELIHESKISSSSREGHDSNESVDSIKWDYLFAPFKLPSFLKHAKKVIALQKIEKERRIFGPWQPPL